MVDFQDKTKSNSSSDHTSEPDEDLLLEGQFTVIAAYVLKEGQKADNWDESANHNHKDLNDDEFRAPLLIRETEEWNTQVDEHECLSDEGDEGEDYIGGVLAHRWQVIVSIRSLNNSTEQ